MINVECRASIFSFPENLCLNKILRGCVCARFYAGQIVVFVTLHIIRMPNLPKLLLQTISFLLEHISGQKSFARQNEVILESLPWKYQVKAVLLVAHFFLPKFLVCL